MIAPIFCFVLLHAPSARAGELKSVMKDMKAAMSGAMGSATLPEFTKQLERLRQDAQIASRLSYSGDAATYRQGMQDLQRNLEAAEREAKAGDLTAAKSALQLASRTKRRYHDLLN
ncbi:cytochrome B562 [Chromobacterium alticapitis]|uniref:Cytochrome B562 n=2 Tax=Chromobacterium alticapitis TaxID=2073169 RepID=A0A2S5DAZ2_9NEIS|nr:cytochrome B562 [Chromobacterium alticapitis]